MFVIRAEQIEAFRPQAEDTFIRRIMEFLKEKHSDEIVRLPSGDVKISALSDEMFFSMIEDGVSRARKYRITWKSTLKSFVVLMFLTAPNFDSHSAAKKILYEAETPTDETIKKLIEQLTEDEWQEIETMYDANSWKLTVK